MSGNEILKQIPIIWADNNRGQLDFLAMFWRPYVGGPGCCVPLRIHRQGRLETRSLSEIVYGEAFHTHGGFLVNLVQADGVDSLRAKYVVRVACTAHRGAFPTRSQRLPKLAFPGPTRIGPPRCLFLHTVTTAISVPP